MANEGGGSTEKGRKEASKHGVFESEKGWRRSLGASQGGTAE